MKHNPLPALYRRLFSAFGPQHWWPGDTPLEVAVGAVLTQNTNWHNVEKAIRNMKRQRLLSVQALARISPAELALLLRPAGYYNIKAARLKNFIGMLHSDFGGSMARMAHADIDTVRKRLLSVNGIGPETADSIILYALKKPVFVVDAYTKRILSRHGILGHERSYADFQDFFHARLEPSEPLFNEFHALLVRLAKEYCRTVQRCAGCPLEGV